jgi:ketosteroid isomerase-like protein
MAWRSRSPLSPFLLLLVAATLGCNREPAIDGTAVAAIRLEKEAQEIWALSREWAVADSMRDVARAVTFYAPHAVEMASNTPIVKGQDAIQRWYQSWLLNPNNRLEFATDTVEVAEGRDFAYERGTYRFYTKTESGEDVDVGKYLTVWKKIDGQWKVVADMANSDKPLP